MIIGSVPPVGWQVCGIFWAANIFLFYKNEKHLAIKDNTYSWVQTTKKFC
jgi:hypothetical protein